MQRVERRRLEVEARVEPPGFIVERVHQDRPYPDDFGRGHGAQQRIFQQCPPQPPAVLPLIDGQPREKYDADRIIGKPFCHPLRRLPLVHASSGQRMVPYYTVIPMCDVRRCQVALLADPRVSLEPEIERFRSAREPTHIVVLCQLFGGGKGARHTQRLSRTEESASNLRKRGLTRAGRSRASVKAFHCLSDKVKCTWSAIVCSARLHAHSRTNSVTLTPLRIAAARINCSCEDVARRLIRRSLPPLLKMAVRIAHPS